MIPFCLILHWNGLHSLYSCMCLQSERCWKKQKKLEKKKKTKKKKLILASGWLWVHPVVDKSDAYVANMEAFVGMTVASLQTWVEYIKKKSKVKLDCWLDLILNVSLAWSYKRSEFCSTTNTNTRGSVTIGWGVELRWTIVWLIVNGWLEGFCSLLQNLLLSDH